MRVLNLVRADLALVAVSNSWLMIHWARHVEPPSRVNPLLASMPGWAAMLVGAVLAGGLFAYGAALNDGLDSRHDSAFWPSRPIPSGWISGSGAFVVAVLCLLGALAAGLCLGRASAFFGVVAAAAILFYNVTGKYVPAVGIVLVGLIHAMNMWIVNLKVGFAWPIWLNMTHVIACGAVAHRLESKRPRLTDRQVTWLWAGWLFWTMAAMSAMGWRGAMLPQQFPGLAFGPTAAVSLFVLTTSILIQRRMRPLKRRRAAGAEFRRLSLQWLILYDASWLLAAGFYRQAGLHGALFIVSVVLVALLERVDDLLAPPVTYPAGLLHPNTCSPQMMSLKRSR